MRRLNRKASRIIGSASTVLEGGEAEALVAAEPCQAEAAEDELHQRGDHGERDESRPRQEQQEGREAPAPVAPAAPSASPRGAGISPDAAAERAHGGSVPAASTAACSGRRTATLSPICQGRTGTWARSASPLGSISTMQSWNGPAKVTWVSWPKGPGPSAAGRKGDILRPQADGGIRPGECPAWGETAKRPERRGDEMLPAVTLEGPGEQIGDADEFGGEAALRPAVDFLRRAELDQPSLGHDGDAVGERHGLGLVMGDEDGGQGEAPLQGAQLDSQPVAQLGVEIGERLVEQQHPGLGHQRAGQGDALLLAAGELARIAPGEALELDQRQGLGHPAANLRRGRGRA